MQSKSPVRPLKNWETPTASSKARSKASLTPLNKKRQDFKDKVIVLNQDILQENVVIKSILSVKSTSEKLFDNRTSPERYKHIPSKVHTGTCSPNKASPEIRTTQRVQQREDQIVQKLAEIEKLQIEIDNHRLQRNPLKTIAQNQQSDIKQFKTQLLKPVLQTKNESKHTSKAKNRIQRTQSALGDQQLDTVKTKSTLSTAVLPSPQRLNGYMNPTVSSRQRLQMARPTSALAVTPSRNQTVDPSPTFGNTKILSFHELQRQVAERKNSTGQEFYSQIKHITRGDYKKHESPTKRLIEQKKSSLQMKRMFHSRHRSGQQYQVGTDLAYVVKPINELNYDTIDSKPMQFVKDLEQQQIALTKLSKNGSKYQMEDKVIKRFNINSDKARLALQQARNIVIQR